MRVFATFKGSSILEPKAGSKVLMLKWENLSDDAGQDVAGTFLSNKTPTSDSLRVGNRYMMECKEILNGKLSTISETKLVAKNKRCDMMRKAEGIYYFIKGKYKGLNTNTLSHKELHNYMIWLAKNSMNEATINNALGVLELIHKKP